MAKARYEYAKDIDAATANMLQHTNIHSRLSLSTLPIPPESLSVNGTQWFHAVEATATITRTRQRVIRIRVITNTYRGVNVTIPVTELLYKKFRDLRFQIRNSDRVMVAFPELFVMGSPFHHEICLRAYDFKVQEPPAQKPTLII